MISLVNGRYHQKKIPVGREPSRTFSVNKFILVSNYMLYWARM